MDGNGCGHGDKQKNTKVWSRDRSRKIPRHDVAVSAAGPISVLAIVPASAAAAAGTLTCWPAY